MDILWKVIFWLGLAIAFYALFKVWVIRPPRLTDSVPHTTRLYRWIATDDLEMAKYLAKNKGFKLRIIKREVAWTTLHITPYEEALLKDDGITLAR